MKKHSGITIALNPGKAAMTMRILVSQNQPCLGANCKVNGDTLGQWPKAPTKRSTAMVFERHLAKDYHLVMTNIAMERSTNF